MRLAKAGDSVLLVSQDKKHKTFLRVLQPGKNLQTHMGTLQYDDLIGQPMGSRFKTHLGKVFLMLPPSTEELLRYIPRKGQIIFPKEAGYIVMKLAIVPGAVVVEAGTGSGGLTMVLATLVGPQGHVYSYDARNDMQRTAHSNLERLGLLDRVTLFERDIATGFEQHDADSLFLDVQRPWEYLDQAHSAMNTGGFFGSLVPTTNQLVRIVGALESHKGFEHVEVVELLSRHWKTIPGRMRPLDRMVAHTAFLIFARSVIRPEPSPGDEAEQQPEEWLDDD